MRNKIWMPAAFLLLAGCAASNMDPGRQDLRSGYQSLNQGDYNGAMNAARKFQQDHPDGGPGTAEALYLEGRVYEQRAAVDDAAGRLAQAKTELEYARGVYVHALSLPASRHVTTLIHSGAANVAYFQDDYTTAMNEWAIAYPDVAVPEDKAWTLYRIGVCQQRLGRFEQADRSFAAVRQQFPGSVPAERATSRLGARGFYVQVGAYADAANAGRIIASLQSQGFRALRVPAANGRLEVRVGPAYTFADAKALQSRLLSAYPRAIIEP